MFVKINLLQPWPFSGCSLIVQRPLLKGAEGAVSTHCRTSVLQWQGGQGTASTQPSFVVLLCEVGESLLMDPGSCVPKDDQCADSSRSSSK